MKSGRPTKLNDNVKRALLNSVEYGRTLKGACKDAGISYSTFANWRQKRKSRLSEEPLTELDHFLSAILKAKKRAAENRDPFYQPRKESKKLAKALFACGLR